MRLVVIERNFLWRGCDNEFKYPVKWELSEKSKELGGLGIRDILPSIEALLMKKACL